MSKRAVILIDVERDKAGLVAANLKNKPGLMRSERSNANISGNPMVRNGSLSGMHYCKVRTEAKDTCKKN